MPNYGKGFPQEDDTGSHARGLSSTQQRHSRDTGKTQQSIAETYLIFVTGTTGGACVKKFCPVSSFPD